MNNERRKQLAVAVAILEKAQALLEDVYAQEEEAHDSMPENMQYNSERSEQMQDAINSIDGAKGEVEFAIDELNSCFDLPSASQAAIIETINSY